MILNEAIDIRYGEIGQEAVYSKGELVWPSDNNYIYSIDNNEASLIYYLGNRHSVITPKYFEGKLVKVIEGTCYNYNENITSATIRDGVTEIE